MKLCSTSMHKRIDIFSCIGSESKKWHPHEYFFFQIHTSWKRLAGSSPTRGGRLVAKARDQQPFALREWGLESCSLGAFLHKPPCKKDQAGTWLQDYWSGSPDQNKHNKNGLPNSIAWSRLYCDIVIGRNLNKILMRVSVYRVSYDIAYLI